MPDDEAIFSGAMNSQCVWHIDVGATPEQGPANQDYDKSDLGFARFKLHFHATVPPNTTNTYWLRVPPIHRREPVSMGYIAHAFRDVLPGEAVPPFSPEQVRSLQAVVAGRRRTGRARLLERLLRRAPPASSFPILC